MKALFRKLPSNTIGAAVLSTPLLVLLVVVIAAFAGTSAQNTVSLPIEVIGPDGYTKSLTIQASNGSQAESLYLRAYSIGYPKWENYDVSKASVRINGGSWTDLTDAIANCAYPESELDCIDGPQHTIEFEVATSDIGGSLVDGQNTIDFRFNYAFPDDSPDDFGDPSTGYRILGLQLQNAGGTSLIDGTSFIWEDPANWEAPNGYSNPDSVAEGKELWGKRDVLVDHWGENETITASCADCHASDGRDLSYFAFSNWSIIARSEFHGLTKSQGKKIAAYIRSLELQDVDDGHTYDAPGRPWYGVYQPGPSSAASRSPGDPRTAGTRITEMPSNGSQYAAAGAGDQWALDEDEAALPYVFPGGPSDDDFDIDESLDGMHVPVQLQFADWNEWLPVHHPLDMYGDAFKTWSHWRSGIWDPIEGSPGVDNLSFSDYRECVESNGADDPLCLNQFQRAATMAAREATFFQKRNEGNLVRPDYENVTSQDDEAYRAVNTKKWVTVKTWAGINTFDLMDEWHHLSETENGLFDKGWSDVDRLTWPGGFLPFDMSPHLTGEYAGPKNEPWSLYLSNIWYEIAVRMNSGRGFSTGNRPVDWQYQNGFALGMTTEFGIEQPLRLVFSHMKALEVCESFDGPPDTPRAWEINRSICGPQLGHIHDFLKPLDTYQSGLHKRTFEILFEEQVKAMMYRHSPNLNEGVDANWKRLDDERKGWEPENTPVNTDPGVTGGWWRDPSKEPSHFYEVLRLGNELGVRPTLLDSAAAWNDAMVPDPAWDDFRCSKNGGLLDCSISQQIQLQTGWNLVSSRVSPSDPSIDQVFSDVDGLSEVKDTKGDPYLPEFNVDEVGTWSAEEGYKVHVEESQTMTLTGHPVPQERSIDLEAGCNLLPYYPTEPMNATVAFTPIEDILEFARDEDANEYNPSEDVNNIGQLVPGEAYTVCVTQDTTFTYPSNSTP